MDLKQLGAVVCLIISGVVLLWETFKFKPIWEIVALAVVTFVLSAIYIWGDVDDIDFDN